nr:MULTISPECIES: YejG family protein [Citrobacter]
MCFRGKKVTTLQLSIVHRLPQNYRWSAGFAGSKVEPIPQNGQSVENSLVALKLLSPDGDSAWPVMHKLSQALSDIEVPCSVLECEGEPCLFVNRQDEFAATCRLKNFGVAIAEPFSNNNPF